MNAPDHKYGVLMALILLCCAGIWAVRQPSANDQRPGEMALLGGVPAPEIPTVAVRRLQEVTPGKRLTLLTQMLQELQDVQPGALPYFVGAVSRRFPEVAPWLLVEAISQNPEQTVACVRAASAAVPDQLALLTSECVRNLPESFPLVAITAAQQHPDAAEAILQAIGRVLPEARTALETATRRQQKFPVDVWEVLAEADRLITNRGNGDNPGEKSDGQTQPARQMAGNNGNGRAEKSPFASLQQLARARLEKERQQSHPESDSNATAKPVSPAALSKTTAPLSVTAPGVGNINKTASQVEVR
ncbi:hypothetical protein NXS98_00755 [Fontisphaera persica]|jgi:hypothetical protein|uniref:hypothetical protein n=1 Tax=Fontisphaera persica TaxID=2974023 RepID=UPI0024C0957F|nr:hypothetical protein [Fontisphaera persica]WCJ59680.1 hypothetical protein NXS98_00755 [Fontisphaera persica]